MHEVETSFTAQHVTLQQCTVQCIFVAKNCSLYEASSGEALAHLYQSLSGEVFVVVSHKGWFSQGNKHKLEIC